MADRGDGWAPFPAPAELARTARTVALDTVDALAAAIDDLRSRLVASERDPDRIDVCFACSAGGDAASDAFDSDAHLEGLAELAAIGVTWVQVGLPDHDLAHTIATVERYGEQVISRS